MFQTVKINILIPLQYNHDDYSKTEEGHEQVSKAEIDICKEEKNYSSAGWFHYCFRNKPIENNFQMANSPLLTNSTYKISRLEMDSVVRASVGLHKNENTVYTLSKIGTPFTIGKVRVLFTNSTIAFLFIEITASDLTEEATRKFVNTFSRVTSTHPYFAYQQKVAKDAAESRKISLRHLPVNFCAKWQKFCEVKY